MNIGSEIKRLRKAKGLSQNELAEVLHVTSQSISKWESNTSYPDINQLPAIASFFGITIDELFVYPTDLEYERIEKAIENGNPLSNETFVHDETFLLEEIRKNPQNHKALSMLGDLYHFEACRLNDKAAYYAMQALHIKPDNKLDLCTLNNASNGHINDWNISCHYKLIEKLYSLLQSNPADSDRTKLFLLDNLIADGRFEEAERILAERPDCKLREVYETMIEERQHGYVRAKASYYKLIEENTDKWEVLMEVANRLAFNGEYQDAIDAYEKAFEAAPKPRYTDMLASVAYLNKCLGNEEATKEAYKRELTLLKDEWNITKGELVDSLKRNIGM